jgi:hypothetical protein
VVQRRDVSTDKESMALRWSLFVVVSLVNGLLLWHFHDRYWYPTDDGFYANIAERFLNGEVLNRDLQDIHPGYIHVVHAFAFRLFGVDMVSLRYPLMVAAGVQACFTYALLARRDPLTAAVASVAGTALGVIQFVDPTPNWYCLSLCVALAWWLLWLPARHPARLVGAGVLLGVLTLFRHLSGLWVAMGVLSVVMLEQQDDGRGRDRLLARAVIGLMLLLLVTYLVVSPETEPGGLLLMAVWPMAILVWLLVRVQGNSADLLGSLAQLAAGGLAAALPLVLYHIVNGSLAQWATDNLFVAVRETALPFFGRGWYGVLPLAALYQAVTSFHPLSVVNGIYWVLLPVLSALNGASILRRLRARDDPRSLILPILASFYTLTSLLFEGPLYLYYSAGLSLASVLWLAAAGRKSNRLAWTAVAGSLSVVAIVFHAGQSRLRTPIEILQGKRVSNTWTLGASGLDRCRLRLDEADHKVYGQLVQIIQSESASGDSILALPNDAELYFLTRRRNPVRFYNSALGIQTATELQQVMAELTGRPPRIVTFRPDDKYVTDASRHIMELVRLNYASIATIDGLEVYRLR